MATIRINDEQGSGKGYAYGLCGFADLRTDYARSTGAKYSNPQCFLTKTIATKTPGAFYLRHPMRSTYNTRGTV